MIGQGALEQLDAAVLQVCRTGDATGLPVLGHGEISIVVGWPPEAPVDACKRLPPFASRTSYDAYAATFDRYLEALRGRGVDVLDSRLVSLDAPAGGVTAYCIQPILDGALGSDLLRAGPPDADHPVLGSVMSSIATVVDERVGFDGQLTNWGQHEGRLVYLDVTTPLLRDAAGRNELDTGVFLAATPWALRPALARFVVPGIVSRYHVTRTVVLDVATNLLRIRLDAWLPALLEAARHRAGVVLSAAEVRRDYRSESRTWGALQVVRRADRLWQQRVRRRDYPFLIPERTGW